MTALDVRDRLVIATDGSVATSPRHPLSAWAWIDQDGRYATGALRSRSILTVELAGIASAISSTPRDRALLVLCDSRPAIRQIEVVMATGRIPDRSGACGARDTAALLHRISMHLRNRPIAIRWVKGHAGHALNEAADRLALQTRLAQGPESVRGLLARIAAEALPPRPVSAA